MEKKKTISKRSTEVAARGLATGISDALEGSQASVWQSYHVVTEHWKLDLQFEKDEVNFFGKLISEHFTQFMDSVHAERSRKLTAALIKLDRRREDLQIRIATHGVQMLKIVENPFPIVDELLYKHDHEQLENEMLTFIKDHRLLKGKLMLLAEEILRTEKLMHLLSAK